MMEKPEFLSEQDRQARRIDAENAIRKDERRKVWEEAAKIAELQKAEEGLKHVQYGEEGRMTASNASLRQAMMAARLASIFRAKAEE